MATLKPGSGRTPLKPHERLKQVSVWVLPKYVKIVKAKCVAIASKYR